MKSDGFIKRVADQRTSKPVANQRMAKVEPKMGARHSPKPGKPVAAKKPGRRG